MREIILSNGMVAQVDDEDYERVVIHKWIYDPAGQGYARAFIGVGVSRRSTQIHRFILDAPVGVQVDHINGDGLDNRRCNLRLVNRSQNQQNTFLPPSNKTGYKGVHWDKTKGHYRASIMKDKQTHRLGRFDSCEEAAHAYDAAAREMFGEYARLNFPLPGERSAHRDGGAKRKTVYVASKNRSGFHGVHLETRGHKWRAEAQIKGVRYHLGMFASPEDAARAYDAAIIEHGGQLTRLNFPMGIE
jgi:hypothetical protein